MAILTHGKDDLACPLCGQSLLGVQSDRCPECGGRFRLAAVAASTPTFWWISSIIAAGIACGIACLIAIPTLDAATAVLIDPRLPQLIAAGAASPTAVGQWSSLLFMTPLLSACGLALAVAICSRRWLTRATGLAEASFGIAYLLLPLAVVGAVRMFPAIID